MSHASRLTFAALALFVLAGPALAQESSALAAVAAVDVASTGPTGPRVEATRAGIQARSAVVTSAAATAVPAPAPMRRADSQRARTLMIIGGAALLGGAIIGDDAGQIVMLGGLGVGLYGLYLYLQ